MPLSPPVRSIDAIADNDELEERMAKVREINAKRAAHGQSPVRPEELTAQVKPLRHGW